MLYIILLFIACDDSNTQALKPPDLEQMNAESVNSH